VEARVSGLEVGVKLDELLDAEVVDADGERHALHELIGGKLTLAVFLRHFGCIGCSQQVDVLVPMLDELAALDVVTILIGNGDARYIAAFRERQRLEGYLVMIVTDATLGSHRAAGFGRSLWATYGPRALWADLRAMGKGYSLATRQGDGLQQGGVLLIDRDGRLAFRQAASAAPEPVSAAVILEAVLGQVGREARNAQKGLA
jgi:peroxiredoxin